MQLVVPMQVDFCNKWLLLYMWYTRRERQEKRTPNEGGREGNAKQQMVE